MQHQKAKPWQIYMGHTDEQLVPSDLIGCNFSSIFDAGEGIALNDSFVKLILWCVNEFGYSNRVCDLMIHMSKKQ